MPEAPQADVPQADAPDARPTGDEAPALAGASPAAPAPKPGGRGRPNLTEGPVTKTLLAFAIPGLLGSVVQSLSGTVNAVWIGQLLGPEAFAATTNANGLFFFLLSGIMGMSMAATMLVGQAVGAQNTALVKRTVGTGLSFFGLLAVGLGAVGYLSAPQLLAAMRTPPELLGMATDYLRVIFLGWPFLTLGMFYGMALRGAGDAKTPMIFMVLSLLLDAALNPWFMLGWGPVPPLGIAGAAWATFVSQAICLVGTVWWVQAKRLPVRLEPEELSHLRIDWSVVKSFATKGLPMGVSVVMVSASMLALLGLVNQGGHQMAAAYGACFQLWSYIQMPGFALGGAVTAMAAQNVGAKRWDRVGQIAGSGTFLAGAITLSLVGLVSLFQGPVFGLFLGKDAASLALAHHIHLIVSWSFVLFSISMVLSSVMRATGAVLVPTLLLFTALWVVRIPFAYGLHGALGPDAIWWSFPAGAIASVLLSVAYYRFGRWREAKLLG